MIALALLLVAPAGLPPCRADALSLGFDGENGAFNGMSHSGALLVVRNVGAVACTVPGLPVLRFRDAGGRTLPIRRRPPVGMHPGPVVLPVGLAPGAEATAALRWVSGPVFLHSRCLAVAGASLAIGPGAPATSLAARICGRAGDYATIDQPVLATDPVLAGHPVLAPVDGG